MQLCSLGQGTVSQWSIVPRCPRVLQVFPTVSDSSQISSSNPSYPTLLEALATPWDSVEQCSTGTLSLVPMSKVASSGRTCSRNLIMSKGAPEVCLLKFAIIIFILCCFYIISKSQLLEIIQFVVTSSLVNFSKVYRI